jgi:hypothetical protein
VILPAPIDTWVAPARLVAHDLLSMLFIFLLRGAPGALPIMLLTLAVALYLTVIELRELNVHWKWWAWWLSLVFLTHFVGYLILRVYVAFRRRHDARA